MPIEQGFSTCGSRTPRGPRGATKGSAVNPIKTGDPSNFNFLLSKNTGHINVVGTGYNVQN